MPTEQEIQDRLARLESRVGLRTNARQVRPFEHEPRIPVVHLARVLATFPEDGVTTVIVGWETPDHPEFETVELYVKDLSNEATGIVKVGEAREGPATLVLTADANTAKTIFLRTKMRNGLGSELTASPTVTAEINKLTVSGASLEDGSVTTNKLANLAVTNAKIDNLAVTDAKIQSLSAAKITAGTLQAGVVYAGTINASQINAGTLNSVNVNAGTYTLVSGANQMLINGSQGFFQITTAISPNRFVQIKDGTIFTDIGSSEGVWLGGSIALNWNGSPRVNIDTGLTSGRLDIRHSDGSGPVFLDVETANNGRVWVGDGNSVRCELRVNGSNGELCINGTRVVTNRQTDPGASPTTEQLRQILLAHGLI